MKIQLHWGVSNLMVATIIISMLAATNAIAIQKPFPCWTCCPDPPSCTSNINYRFAVGDTNRQITTIYTTGKLPTPTQLQTTATQINNAVSEDYNQWVETATAWIDQNATLLEQPTINVSQLWAALQSVSYQPNNEAQILAWAQSATQAQRTSFVQFIQQNGLFALGVYINNQASLIESVGQMYSILPEGEKMPDGPCQALAIATATIMLYAAVLAFIPGGQGAALISGLMGALTGFIYAASC